MHHTWEFQIKRHNRSADKYITICSPRKINSKLKKMLRVKVRLRFYTTNWAQSESGNRSASKISVKLLKKWRKVDNLNKKRHFPVICRITTTSNILKQQLLLAHHPTDPPPDQLTHWSTSATKWKASELHPKIWTFCSVPMVSPTSLVDSATGDGFPRTCERTQRLTTPSKSQRTRRRRQSSRRFLCVAQHWCEGLRCNRVSDATKWTWSTTQRGVRTMQSWCTRALLVW